LLEKCKIFQMKIQNLNDEQGELKEEIKNNLLDKENELQSLEENKNAEINRHRENLYNKITSLTNLLEMSNKMINDSENENLQLKEKIEKLEYNLNMLTKSHLELE